MAKWFVFEDDTPQCTSCGMWMPFARYQKGNGTNARKITDYCPHCGKKMIGMPMCDGCEYGNGQWKDNGICFACREQVWIPGRPHIRYDKFGRTVFLTEAKALNAVNGERKTDE